jgi:hypothetical protein
VIPLQIVTLPFKSGTSEQESHRGVMISRWLKEQGLNMGRDYTWRVDQSKKELQFMFNGDAEAWATLITMRDL